ncbi:MAG TPA: hypothetical protein VF297_12500 [Pyrinomonadaceae bacterium]
MLETYRRAVSLGDASMLQPLANSCWRAGAFEWALYQDAATVRRLWGEAARALTEGFTRRRPGFDPSPDQFVLALHFAIAAREREAFVALAMSAPNLRDGVLREARAFVGSRAHFHLAEGFALVARALVQRQGEPARAAVASLDAAREESDSGWWGRQFPDPLDAAWRTSEHEAVCLLLRAVAGRLAGDEAHGNEEDARRQADTFARTIEETLRRLQHFTRHDINHHPKLYVWLSGLSLCALAASAALPMHWIEERCEAEPDVYARLPLALLSNPSA